MMVTTLTDFDRRFIQLALEFEFISNPLYRSYVFTYSWGYDLVERVANAGGGDKHAIFMRLLTEQVLPSQLEAIASNGTLPDRHL